MAGVVIFDSGVGGLSIYQEIKKLLSADQTHQQASRRDREAQPLIFFSDNAAYPYGLKSDQQLLDRVAKVADAINDEFQPELLVVACNTASTVALPLLRGRLACEVVGVVPAIKPAAHLSKNKVIGLLATPATIRRSYTESLIEEFAADCKVIKVGSSELVDLAELKMAGQAVELPLLEHILEPLLQNLDLDTLVLACTHFPLVADEINQVLAKYSRKIKLVDSGAAIARRVESLLGRSNLPVGDEPIEDIACFSQAISSDSDLSSAMQSFGITQIRTIQIEQ